MSETKEGEETGEDVCGSGGREQDEVIDESFTDSPRSTFLPTQQKPGLVSTQQKHVPARPLTPAHVTVRLHRHTLQSKQTGLAETPHGR